jgi:putative nucleotidyltransferase with HDIG domain
MFEWKRTSLALRIVILYFLFGLVWILLSDTIVDWMATTSAEHRWFQTYKGMFFVASSSVFLGWMIRRESKRRLHLQQLFEGIVELVPDPLVIRGYDDGRILEVNDAFAREVGRSPSALTDMSIDDLGLTLDGARREAFEHRLDEEGELHGYRRYADSSELLVSSQRLEMDSRDVVCTVAKDIGEMRRAYDETVRGWARALELRDDETFGHTLRVTRATIALARKIGIDDADVVHVRRGALLHDIGKIGIPDTILHKEGELTDEEWEIVRQHPVLARELLEPITHLRPALDIPYHHHEKWDGSGYPEGLAGEEIPLAARTFAVVDVWDALRSERPYRDAWEPDRVLEHLESQKGTHFQPGIVDAFLDLGDERRATFRDVDSTSILDQLGMPEMEEFG